jgi:hypothetical protein
MLHHVRCLLLLDVSYYGRVVSGMAVQGGAMDDLMDLVLNAKLGASLVQ